MRQECRISEVGSKSLVLKLDKQNHTSAPSHSAAETLLACSNAVKVETINTVFTSLAQKVETLCFAYCRWWVVRQSIEMPVWLDQITNKHKKRKGWGVGERPANIKCL